jgi:alpha-galactosidase
VTVQNTTTSPVSLVGLEWASKSGGGIAGVDRLLHHGYQSWSYTGIEAIPESIAETLGTARHGGDNEDVLGELPGVSWWWSAATDADGRGVTVGADGGTVLKTFVAFDGAGSKRLRVVQGMTGDTLVLAPNETRSLDGLYVAFGDARRSLDEYSKYVAALHPSPLPRKPALGGWGSWNMYYAGITAATLREEAKFASSTLVPVGLSDFLLDDGYETHWGSWAASPAFGADLPTLTSEQSAGGLRPALWLAPFYVAVEDPIVAQHPDWFVHQKDGKLRTFSNVGPVYAALDVTVPEARGRVETAVRGLRDMGFRTLKIDFLFGGATEGTRRQPITSLESYGLWMKTLREAVPDVHIVGCGAPILPSVGWVDSMRIGPDIAFVTSPEPLYPFLTAQARHVALRAHTDAFWALDPDVLLLRGTRIDDAEAWSVVVFSALSGGNYLLGDGRQATPLRRAMALAPEMLSLARDGIAARPQDLAANIDPKLFSSPLFMGNTDTAIPHVWRKIWKDGTHGALGLFGWELDTYTTDVELPDNAEEVMALAQPGPARREPSGGKKQLTVGRHAARLFVW